MIHPTEDELRLFLDDRSSAARSATIADHLDVCEQCREAAERLTRFPDELWANLGVAEDRPPPVRSGEENPAVAGYKGFRLLGRGGSGVVYLATESATGRRAAVKFLRGGATASPQERAWFLDEARAAANLRHPNIVTVLAVGEERGQPYYVMEHFPDGTLADRLRAAPLGPAEAAALTAEIARAIQYAHDAGVIHRDLKPANILLDVSTRSNLPWSPKVADFGMAKLRESALRSATPTQAIFGTPDYMAPEQAFGRSRDVGPAADVYALGAILYELLTGRPPFRGGTSYETLLMVRDQEPSPPRRVRPGLPRDLETVCLKCLEKEPRRRYPSAAALAADLDAYLEGRPVAARPVSRLGRLERWSRREPVVAGLSAAAVLLAALLFAVVTVSWRRAAAQQARLSEAADRARARGERLLEALAFSAEATSKLFLRPGLITRVDREILIDGLKALEQASDLPDSPDKEHRLAYATLQMANGLYGLGEQELSARSVRRAVATLDRLMKSAPEHPEFAYHYAEGCIQLGAIERAAGRRDEEIRLHAEALRTAERLAERDPGRDAYASDLADFRSRVAEDLLERGRRGEAERLLEQSTVGFLKLIARYPEDPWRYGAFRHASLLLAALKFGRGDREAYDRLVRDRLELNDRARGQPDWQWIFTRLMWEGEAVVFQRSGCERAAETFLSYGLARWREIVDREPKAADARAYLATWLAADGYRAWPSDPTVARERFREAIEIFSSLLDGPERSSGLLNSAWLRAVCPDPEIRDAARAVDLARDHAAEFDRSSLVLGVGLCENGDYEAAREEIEQRLAEPTLRERSWEDRLGRLYLASAYRGLRMEDRAAEETLAAEARPPVTGTVDWHVDAAFRRVEATLAEASRRSR